MIYLTYQDWACKDGLGAQLQRILSIYQTAKLHGLGYIHTPISDIENQGVAALEDASHDSKRMVEKANRYFMLMSDKCDHYDVKENITVFTKDLLEKKDDAKIYLYSIRFGHYTNDNPEILNVPIPFPWIKKELGQVLYIGCHIRRGDVTVQETQRLLPNSYYINCLTFLAFLLDRLDCRYEIHIFTESSSKEITVSEDHPIFKASLRGTAIIKPADDLDDLRAIKNSTLHLNGCAVDSIIALTNADILIGSKSSFSYTAGLMNQKGVKIFHPFWCALPKHWIAATNFEDLLKQTDQIERLLHKTAIHLPLFRQPIYSKNGIESMIARLFLYVGTTNKRFTTLGNVGAEITDYLKLWEFTGCALEDTDTMETCDLLHIRSRKNYQSLSKLFCRARVIVTNFNVFIPPGIDQVLVNFASDSEANPCSSITSLKNMLKDNYSLIATCDDEAIFLRNDAANMLEWTNCNNEKALVDPSVLKEKGEAGPPNFLPSLFL